MDIEYKNHEGYADSTAYFAIKKGDKAMEFRRGEVFEYEMNNGDIRNVLVVSADYRSDSRMLSIVALNDHATNEDSIALSTVRGMMYADPWMVGFAPNHRFQEYVCSVKDEELAAVGEGIAEALGLHLNTEKAVANVREASENNYESYESLELEDALKMAAKEEARADTYKELYEQLLDKILER